MWLNQVKSGFASHIVFKCIGITVFISAFFIAYFHVLNHPASATTIIPLTYFDHLISFQPLALPIYLSLWVYVAIAPVLIVKLDELYAFTLSIALMSIVGLAIFYFWPTSIPLREINWELYPSMQFLKEIDAAGNACPSMHVASAVFSGAWLDCILRRIQSPSWARVMNIIWGIAIIHSTMATRQHVALDVLGGIVLALMAVLLARLVFWKKD